MKYVPEFREPVSAKTGSVNSGTGLDFEPWIRDGKNTESLVSIFWLKNT
jgi:hypothetical protein